MKRIMFLSDFASKHSVYEAIMFELIISKYPTKTFTRSFLKKKLPFLSERIIKTTINNLINKGFVEIIDNEKFETTKYYKLKIHE